VNLTLTLALSFHRMAHKYKKNFKLWASSPVLFLCAEASVECGSKYTTMFGD
jgi:hypothetical protein